MILTKIHMANDFLNNAKILNILFFKNNEAIWKDLQVPKDESLQLRWF